MQNFSKTFIKLVRGEWENLSGLLSPTIVPNFVEIHSEMADLEVLFEICMALYGSDIYTVRKSLVAESQAADYTSATNSTE